MSEFRRLLMRNRGHYITFSADSEQKLSISFVHDEQYECWNFPKIEYSFDKITWTESSYEQIYGLVDTITFGGTKGDLYLRGNGNNFFSQGSPYNMNFVHFGFENNNVPTRCYGNIMYLLDYKSSQTSIPTEFCFLNLFRNCKSLTTAPELPATTLTSYCYRGMFYGCTSLTKAPKLPTTIFQSSIWYCYCSMFEGCTALTTAPELPATTLSGNCYDSMFEGCTALTTAPTLPATTLAGLCYNNMFKGCSKLNYIKCLATDISANGCTDNWVDGVASTGTFVKDASMTGWSTGTSGIPSGWTVQNT